MAGAARVGLLSLGKFWQAGQAKARWGLVSLGRAGAACRGLVGFGRVRQAILRGFK